MRQPPRLPGFALVLVLMTAVPPPARADMEAPLVSEPLWLLQRLEGPLRPMWFERRPGGAGLVACSASAGCDRPVRVHASHIELEGTGPVIVWPESNAGSAWLVPAWVVPAPTARLGH